MRMKTIKCLFGGLSKIGWGTICLLVFSGYTQAHTILEEGEYTHQHTWWEGRHTHPVGFAIDGFILSGQATAIYQSSDLDLKLGDLVDENGAVRSDYAGFDHKNGEGTFSTDLFLEKEIGDEHFFMFNLEYANGAGIDAPLQGGAMVNNDVMEYDTRHKAPYIARVYYEYTKKLAEGYKLKLDLGKFGVTDFFDQSERVADQTTQFLNQAICNNGAFDYVQDLEGHGYTYGVRAALETTWVTVSGAYMSSDNHISNLEDKYSIIGAVAFEYEFYEGADEYEEIELEVNIYAFRNFGEYGSFDGDGTFHTKNADAINTKNNQDDLDKAGFGVNLTQKFSYGISLFAKYGQQDDDRDVRHNQDMDESIMFGLDVSGRNWGRNEDVFGVSYEIGRLTGNHRKAHEKGYESFFNRSGIGAGNYAGERVLEAYYNYTLNEHLMFSLDYQYIDNFYYSKKIGSADFWGVRVHMGF